MAGVLSGGKLKDIVHVKDVVHITLVFIFPFISIVLLVVMFAAQHTDGLSFMPVVQIDSSRLDLYNGMYSLLQQGYSDMSSDNTVETVTTSTVLLIANLSTALLESTPNKVYSTFKKSCFLFDRSEVDDSSELHVLGGTVLNSSASLAAYCEDTRLFDYRTLLDNWGYSYMLALTETSKADDSSYHDYQTSIDAKSDAINRVPSLLVFVLVSQFVTLLVSFYIWNTRRHIIARNNTKLLILGHVLSIWTLITFIVALVACLTMTVNLLSIRSMAEDDFASFGVKVKLCTNFFGVMWTVFAISFFTMAVWVGPMWCSAPEHDDTDDDDAGSAYDSDEGYELERFDTVLDDDDDLDFKLGRLERDHTVEHMLRKPSFSQSSSSVNVKNGSSVGRIII